MEKRLKNYIAYMGTLAEENFTAKEEKKVRRELMAQIQFFQHERLVHLIVTVTFAILTMLALLGFFLTENIGMLVLTVLFLLLLVPYIRHYYILENGVQKLYIFFDELGG